MARSRPSKCGRGTHTVVRRGAAGCRLILYECFWHLHTGDDGCNEDEIRHDVQQSYLSKRPSWLANGRIQNKLQALHSVAFPAFSGYEGTGIGLCSSCDRSGRCKCG